MLFILRTKLWKDYKLVWNASEYGGVQSIRLPSSMIWTPDILMYNRYDPDSQVVTHRRAPISVIFVMSYILALIVLAYIFAFTLLTKSFASAAVEIHIASSIL